jgi:hypothetical protein
MGQNWGGGNYLGTWSIHVFPDISISIQIVSILQAWAKSDKNWQFGINDLHLNLFDLQHLESSLHHGQVWPAHVIVSQIKNILMPVGSLDDDWFKSYAHICEKRVFLLCDLDLGSMTFPSAGVLWRANTDNIHRCRSTGYFSQWTIRESLQQNDLARNAALYLWFTILSLFM